MKMKKPIFGLLLSAVTFCNAHAGDVSFKSFTVEDASRKRSIETLVWYPAKAGGELTNLGDNPLFKGVPVLKDASIADGPFPLVVLSHGSGGNAANLGWLAKPLVEAGFMVAAPNHPGTTSGDSHPAETVLIWNRPMDLSAVLTGVINNSDFGKHVDQRNISVVGFSLGGYAALAAVGARVNADAIAQYCDDVNKNSISDCRWYAKGNVDLHKLDTLHVNQSNLDNRFSTVIAIDPALAQAFVGESLSALKARTLIINLGSPAKIPLGVDASKIVNKIPGAQYHVIADAWHPSFLGECKPNGKEILRSEGDEEPLCDDGGGRSRAEIHDEIFGRMLGFLKSKLTN
jgi:predicted dienelactone hydrolase